MVPRVVLAVIAVLVLSPIAAATPLPGLNGETTNSIPVIGRVFPEPLQTNDYIGYFEALAGLQFLNKTYPDRVEFIPIGKSAGWPNRITGQREPQTVFLVEVTNEKSPVPRDERLQLLFMLSIHGNEKGGREGGLRTIEDFAKGNVGLLAEQPALLQLLDYFVLIFLFPNADGWTHDEAQYYASQPSTLYTRENANGKDLNRQFPTSGFMQESHQTLKETEIVAVTSYLRDHYRRIVYASDIHGMLQPADARVPPSPFCTTPPSLTSPCVITSYNNEIMEYLTSKENGHFILGLLPAGQLTQLEMARQTRLGEMVRERLGAYQGFAPYTAAPSVGVWGGSFVRWGTVWETINYQVSGGSHDWFVSDRGLSAPSFSFEMSYNHAVCDGWYPGCGAAMNHFHVNAVRQIVATFLEAATRDFQISVEVQGHKTAYLVNPKILTSESDRPIEGWAAQNPLDDRWQYNATPYRVSINDFFDDLAPYLREGDRPAVFDALRATEITAETLGRYDTFVIAGSAYEQVRGDAAKLAVIKSWVEAGNNLVVTDSALQIAGDVGAVEPSMVKSTNTYMGYTDVETRDEHLAKDMVGFSRQTFEGVPVGYSLSTGAPNWYFDGEFKANAKVVGTLQLQGTAGLGGTRKANYGELDVGQGHVTFLGALLPDPSNEQYHPYGLVSYSTSYAGNQFFFNMLGFDVKYEAPPLVLENVGQLRNATDPTPKTSPEARPSPAEADGVPSIGFALATIAVIGVGAVLGRRRLR